MKRFVLALPLAAMTCCSCSQVNVQSLSTRIGETEAQQVKLATPTPVATSLPIPAAIPTAVPSLAPAASGVTQKPTKKRLVILTFPLPPVPSSKNNGPEFRAFTKGVVKQLTDGRDRVIAANHRIAGEYANAKELIYDSGLFKESVTSAQKTTLKNMADCAKLSQYAKNAFSALQSLSEKDVSSNMISADLSQQLLDINRAYFTLLVDLQIIKVNLEDLQKNAETANSQYLDDSVQSGLTTLGKIHQDMLDLKAATGTLSGSLHNSAKN